MLLVWTKMCCCSESKEFIVGKLDLFSGSTEPADW
jgi:hypothetical protein